MSRYAVVHNTPRCRKVAFFIRDVPLYGAPPRADDVVLPNGRHPVKGRKSECFECGEPLAYRELVYVHEDEELPVMANVYVIPPVVIGREA